MAFLRNLSRPADLEHLDASGEGLSIKAIQEAMDEDPEVKEAIDNLVYALESGIRNDRAFEAFKDRIFARYLKNKSNLERE